MALGNKTADHLAMPMFKPPAEDHAVLHTNVHCLPVNYHIPWRQARQIVNTCTICAPLNKRTHVAVSNPKGLQANDL